MVESEKHTRETISQLIGWGHWFSFFNIIAAMLLGYSYISQSGWPNTLLGQLYQLVSWIGHFGFLIFAVYVLVVFPASFIIRSPRLMRMFAVLVATAGLTILLLDIYAYQQLGLHLNPMVWKLLLSADNLDRYAQSQHLFISVPAIFITELLIAEWVWNKRRNLSRKQVGKPIVLVFACSFISSHLIYIWADAYLYSAVTAQRSNFPLSYPMTAKSFMEKYGLLDRKEYLRRRAEQGEQDSDVLRYPIEPLSFSFPAKKSNILLVMVESLRADMLNAQVMPQMTQFAEQNIKFARHFSSGNDAMAGTFGLFFSLPSHYAHSARSEGVTPIWLTTLQRYNYQFGLFSGDNFSNPIYFRTIFGKELEHFKPTLNAPAWKTDQLALQSALEWIDTQKQPWFSYVELTNIKHFEQGGDYPDHFTPSLSSLQKIEQHSAVVLKNSYQNATRYTDSLLGDFIQKLRESGKLKNTIVIITANHGNEFNETGTSSWGFNSNYSRYQIQVPFLMHWPKRPAQVVQNASSHLDLVPTLMEEALGVTSPSRYYSSGSNLFDVADTPKKWLLAGDSQDIVLIQENKTTVVDKFGNYNVFDGNYKLQPQAKPELSMLMQAMHELKRFYIED
ncbi:MAG: DUF3413 domain-containing protein [Vibrionaceae bacterium]